MADVNGGGLPDVFIGGTGGQTGVLYLGQPDGSFKAAPDQPWASAKDADDVAATFFDATGHGTVDLFVAAGGVRHERGDPALNDRLYLNDGHGRYTLAPEGAVPAAGEAAGVAVAADFEGTGKPGLFVGGRLVPARRRSDGSGGRWSRLPGGAVARRERGRDPRTERRGDLIAAVIENDAQTLPVGPGSMPTPQLPSWCRENVAAIWAREASRVRDIRPRRLAA